MNSNKKKIILIIAGIILILVVAVSSFYYARSFNKDVTFEEKLESLININELSDEFMDNYFNELAEFHKTDNQEDTLIIISENDIKDTRGANRVIKAPNHQYILQYDNTEQKDEALKSFSEDETILSVEENTYSTLYEDDDSSDLDAYNSWGITRMGLDTANTILESKHPDQVVVGIIDSGLDVTTFKNAYGNDKLIGLYVSSSGVLGSVSEGDMSDELGHGTHVAGTIAEGTASNVKIRIFKVTNADGKLPLVDIIAALNYIVSYSAADVINMSYGNTSASSGERQAIMAAVSNGIIPVGAAGNDNTDANHYPSCYDGVISVAAVDSSYNKASFSNYGNYIDFAAPGVSIKSINGSKNGTSMATPHVTSAAAVLKSFNKNLVVDDVTNLFITAAQDLGTTGWDIYYGNGFINFNNVRFCTDSFCDRYNVYQDYPDDVVKIETNGTFVVTTNYNSLNNLDRLPIKIYYTSDDFYSIFIGDLEGVSVTGYDPNSKTVQTVTISYRGFSDTVSVDNTSFGTTIWRYSLSNSKVTLIGFNTNVVSSWYSKLYLPERINNYDVVAVNTNAVTSRNITSIEAPASITSIGDNAFRNLSLVNVDFKASNLSVGNNSLSNVQNLINLNANIGYVGSYAFDGAKSLRNVTLTNTISSIGNYAFNGCNNLTNINLSNSINSIGSYAFSATKLNNVSLPNNLNIISDGLFENVTTLNTIIIPNSVTTISDWAFANTNLRNITIPQNVSNISSLAFSGTAEKINNVSVNQINAKYEVRDNCHCIIEKDTNKFVVGFKNFTIPNSVTMIGNMAVTNFNNLNKIVVPEGVSTIENFAFYYNSRLQKVILPSSVNNIGSSIVNPYPEDLSSNVIVPYLWVHENSYAENYARNRNISYTLVEPKVGTVLTNKSTYTAFQSVDSNDISNIHFVFDAYKKTSSSSGLTSVERTLDVNSDYSIVYPDNRTSFRYGDNYYDVSYTDEDGFTYLARKSVTINKAVPTYTVPSNITAVIGQSLANVILPDGFIWINPETVLTTVGVQSFIAKYSPSDPNYEEVNNISIPVDVKEGKNILVPVFSIANKTYDQTTNIPANTITINNISNGLYSLVSANSDVANVGNRNASIRLRLTNEAFEDNMFSNGLQEQEFVASLNIVHKLVDKPQVVNTVYTYNGSVQTFNIIVNKNQVNIQNQNRTNAGSQNVLVSLLNNNYRWQDGTDANIQFVFTIDKANPSYVVPSDLTAIVGQHLSDVVLPNGFSWNNPSELLATTGNLSFSATYTPSDTTNYNIVNDVMIDVSVSNEIVEINPHITISNKTYDGSVVIPHDLISVSNLNSSMYSIISANSALANVGTTNAYVRLRLTNEAFATKTFANGLQEKEFVSSLNIVHALLDKPTPVNKTYIYNSTQQSFEFNGLTNMMVVNNGKRTNAGSQNVSVQLKNNNYKWSDNTSNNLVFNFTIEKANPTYNVPLNITATVDQKLSEVSLPVNFTWKNPNEVIQNVGNNDYLAKYTPTDISNYNIIDNIPITVHTSKKILVPSFVIDDKVYDGSEEVPFSLIHVTGIEEGLYEIVVARSTGVDVGQVPVSIKIRLTDDAYRNYALAGYEQETYYLGHVNIIKASIINNSRDYEGNFDDQYHTISINVNIANYNIVYSLDNKNYDLTQIPSFKNIGEYTIYYKITANNYNTYYGSNKVKIYGIDENGDIIHFKDNNMLVNTTSLSDLGSSFYLPGSSMVHYDVDNNVVNTDILKTGDKIEYTIDGELHSYAIVVLGDVNGDGNITFVDYVKIYNHIYKSKVPSSDKKLLTGLYYIAADMSNDNEISFVDYVKVYNVIRNRITG